MKQNHVLQDHPLVAAVTKALLVAVVLEVASVELQPLVVGDRSLSTMFVSYSPLSSLLSMAFVNMASLSFLILLAGKTSRTCSVKLVSTAIFL